MLRLLQVDFEPVLRRPMGPAVLFGQVDFRIVGRQRKRVVHSILIRVLGTPWPDRFLGSVGLQIDGVSVRRSAAGVKTRPILVLSGAAGQYTF
jgi:hypothetical protein